jgi:hypothetical protein
MTAAMSVGITLHIGGTRFELDRRPFQRMRERQARFDSDNSADSSGRGRRREASRQARPDAAGPWRGEPGTPLAPLLGRDPASIARIDLRPLHPRAKRFR